MVGWLLGRAEHDSRSARFELAAQAAIERLGADVMGVTDDLLTVAELLARDPRMDQVQFEDLLQGTGVGAMPEHLVAIDVAWLVDAGRLDEFVAHRELRTHGSRPATGQVPVVAAVFPIAENEPTLGLIVGPDRPAYEAILDSIQTGEVRVSPPTDLVQDPGAPSYAIVLQPWAAADGDDRGAVAGLVHVPTLLAGLVPAAAPTAITVSTTQLGSSLVFGRVGESFDGALEKSVSFSELGLDWDIRIQETRQLASLATQMTPVLLSLFGALTGGIAGLAGLSWRDRTHRAEVVADEAARDLRASNERLETIVRSHERLMTLLAHEMRTPLTVIRAAASSVAGRLTAPPGSPAAWDAGHATDDLVQVMRRIEHRVDQAAVIVTELMETARFEAGDIAVAPEHRSVRDRVIRALRSAALSFPTDVDIQTAGDGEVFVDPDHLDAILTRLLGNAIEHAASRIQVVVRPSGPAEIEIVIEDDGPGLLAEVEAGFGDPWFGANRGGGVFSTGRGLHVVRRMAQVNGGSLDYLRVEGTGSRFVVRLPRSVGSGSHEIDDSRPAGRATDRRA